ncbi:MAG: hypothetical protein KGL35_26910 [Bradyrhizobium sp.]|nr:hypothetical protein [Bradyrhizobium sp.]
MAIKITKEPDIYVTEGELERYRDEYNKCMAHYAGPRITLEEFIRNRQREGSKENRQE